MAREFSYLPLIQLILLRLVLLHQVIQYLLQPVLISLQRRNNILDRSLYKNPINQPETFAVLG